MSSGRSLHDVIAQVRHDNPDGGALIPDAFYDLFATRYGAVQKVVWKIHRCRGAISLYVQFSRDIAKEIS